MKLIKTVQKMIEEAEKRYNEACDKCLDEKTLEKLEKNYLDSLALMKKINNIKKDKEN